MKEKLETILKLIKELKATIADGKTERALEKAQQREDFPDEEDEILSLLARWNSNEYQKMEGVISEANFKVERNSITKSLLFLLNKVEDDVEAELKVVLSGEKKPGKPASWSLPDFGGKPVILFLYAQEDKLLWSSLKKHLFLLFRDKELCFVDLHEAIPLGLNDINSYQEKLIDAATRVLALVTPNIMTFTTYTLSEKALAQNKLIPIRLEEVELADSPFSHDIQGLPMDGKFVSEAPNANSALANIAKHLKLVVEKLKANPS